MNRYCFILIAVSALAAVAQTNPPGEPEPNAVAPGIAPIPHSKSKTPPTEIKPTELTFDTADFFFKSNVFVYKGHVRIDNPQMILTTDKLTIETPKLPAGKYEYAVADGNVVVDFLDDKGQTNHAIANKAIYTYSTTNAVTNAFVDLIGDAVVTDPDGRRIKGNIRWDRVENVIHVTETAEQPRITLPPDTGAPDLISPLRRPKTNAPASTTNQPPK